MFLEAYRSTSRLACATVYAPFNLFVTLAWLLLKLRSGPLGGLFRPDTYIHGQSGAGNNWAKGCECYVVPKLFYVFLNQCWALSLHRGCAPSSYAVCSFNWGSISLPGAELIESILVHWFLVTINPKLNLSHRMLWDVKRSHVMPFKASKLYIRLEVVQERGWEVFSYLKYVKCVLTWLGILDLHWRTFTWRNFQIEC